MKAAKVNIRNVIAYLQGNIRYIFYYSWCRFLIRKHIREQIDFRINSMRRTCYANGFCDECGCKTTQLQMANKSCAGNCYPRMMSRKKWKIFKYGKGMEKSKH